MDVWSFQVDLHMHPGSCSRNVSDFCLWEKKKTKNQIPSVKKRGKNLLLWCFWIVLLFWNNCFLLLRAFAKSKVAAARGVGAQAIPFSHRWSLDNADPVTFCWKQLSRELRSGYVKKNQDYPDTTVLSTVTPSQRITQMPPLSFDALLGRMDSVNNRLAPHPPCKGVTLSS